MPQRAQNRTGTGTSGYGCSGSAPSRPVADVGDLDLVALAVRTRAKAIQRLADAVHDIDVLPLCTPSDDVAFADDALLKDSGQRSSMILNKQPVTDVEALTVDRQRFASESLQRHERDELLGIVIGSVIV